MDYLDGVGSRRFGKPPMQRRVGPGLSWAFLLVVASCVLVVLVWKLASRDAPHVRVMRPISGIGQNTQITLEARDSKHNVKLVAIELLQEGRSIHRMEKRMNVRPSRRCRFWKRRDSVLTWTAPVGRSSVPEIKEGRATLHLTATNDSWGHFFRGGRSELSLNLPVRFMPPQVQVLTTQHYVNQGGCDMVLFRVSPGTIESGVQVGNYFFPSWPLKESMPEARLALFALPYNLDSKTLMRIVARDDAGNQTVTNFSYKIFSKRFRSDTIKLSDDFLARVIPPILSQTPDIPDQGSPLKNFLLVNGHVREINSQQLVGFSRNTSPQFRWTQPFVQLGGSKVEASFADRRSYLYRGQVVDHQDHVGFDLAVTEQAPVVAANDGAVVFAGFFGIFGNAVVLDHGCGLQSLYGHLSSMDVKVGDAVSRGKVIGRSGQTGLAGGDHLHFAVLLQGVPVNPTEWWDAHWIHDRIEAKLALYR